MPLEGSLADYYLLIGSKNSGYSYTQLGKSDDYSALIKFRDRNRNYFDSLMIVTNRFNYKLEGINLI